MEGTTLTCHSSQERPTKAKRTIRSHSLVNDWAGELMHFAFMIPHAVVLSI